MINENENLETVSMVEMSVEPDILMDETPTYLINDDSNTTEYRECLERLRIEISNYLVMAEKGATVPYSALNSRKMSKNLEKLLLDFRKISRRNEASIKSDRRIQKQEN